MLHNPLRFRSNDHEQPQAAKKEVPQESHVAFILLCRSWCTSAIMKMVVTSLKKESEFNSGVSLKPRGINKIIARMSIRSTGGTPKHNVSRLEEERAG